MQQHQICRPIVWQLLQQSYCPSHSGGHGDGHEYGNVDGHRVVNGQGGGSNGGKEKVLTVSNVQTYCLFVGPLLQQSSTVQAIHQSLSAAWSKYLVGCNRRKKITPQRIHSSARPMQIKPKKMQKFHFKAKLHFYMLAGFEVAACIKVHYLYKYVSRIQLPIQKYYQRYVFYAKPTKYVWRLPWSWSCKVSHYIQYPHQPWHLPPSWMWASSPSFLSPSFSHQHCESTGGCTIAWLTKVITGVH